MCYVDKYSFRTQSPLIISAFKNFGAVGSYRNIQETESFLFVEFHKGEKKKSKLTKSPYCGLWAEIFLANENASHRKHWGEGIACISWPGSYWVLKCKE